MSQLQPQNPQPQGIIANTDQPEASNIQPKGITACTDQLKTSNFQSQRTTACTDQPQSSNLQPQRTTACTDQPQGSNHQPQRTIACTDQPQGSNFQPRGTAVCTNQPQGSNQFQPSSWAAKWNSEQTSSDTVLLTKPAPERRAAVPRTYLPLSVFSLIFCFWPTGACAVICSLKTSAMIDDGDIEGARSASKKALVLDIISIAIMVCFILTILIRVYIM